MLSYIGSLKAVHAVVFGSSGYGLAFVEQCQFVMVCLFPTLITGGQPGQQVGKHQQSSE